MTLYPETRSLILSHPGVSLTSGSRSASGRPRFESIFRRTATNIWKYLL